MPTLIRLGKVRAPGSLFLLLRAPFRGGYKGRTGTGEVAADHPSHFRDRRQGERRGRREPGGELILETIGRVRPEVHPRPLAILLITGAELHVGGGCVEVELSDRERMQLGISQTGFDAEAVDQAAFGPAEDDVPAPVVRDPLIRPRLGRGDEVASLLGAEGAFLALYPAPDRRQVTDRIRGHDPLIDKPLRELPHDLLAFAERGGGQRRRTLVGWVLPPIERRLDTRPVDIPHLGNSGARERFEGGSGIADAQQGHPGGGKGLREGGDVAREGIVLCERHTVEHPPVHKLAPLARLEGIDPGSKRRVQRHAVATGC